MLGRRHLKPCLPSGLFSATNRWGAFRGIAQIRNSLVFCIKCSKILKFSWQNLYNFYFWKHSEWKSPKWVIFWHDSVFGALRFSNSVDRENHEISQPVGWRTVNRVSSDNALTSLELTCLERIAYWWRKASLEGRKGGKGDTGSRKERRGRIGWA